MVAVSFYLPLDKLARGLENAQIRYCILHGWQSLGTTTENDLDIVVTREDFPLLEPVLNEHLGGRVVQFLQYDTSGFYFVVGQNTDGIRFSAVDAAIDYCRHGLFYASGEELLRNRQRWNGLWVASPQAEFVYLLSKNICKCAIAACQKARLQELQRILGSGANELIASAIGPYWSARVTNWITGSEWDQLEGHLGKLRRVLRWRRFVSHPVKCIENWVPEIERKYRRWRYPSGIFVALLGPDGAGKSLLVENLPRHLAGAFRRSDRFHLRPAVFGSHKAGPPVTAPHSKPPRSVCVSLLKLLYFVFEYVFGYLLKIRPLLVRSSLVVFDRYYDDLLVDRRRYRYSGSRRLIHWMARFVPRPDIFFILDAPEEQLLARKQELPREELRRQRQAYRSLAADLPNAFVLDATGAPDQVARRAGEICLDYMASRYVDLRSLWLRQERSDLAWLSSALLDTNHARYVSPRDARNGYRRASSFMLLKAKGGRFYLLPHKPRRRAAAALELYNAQNWKARIARYLLMTSAGARLARALAPEVQLVYAVGQNGRPAEHSLLGHLRRLLSREDMDLAISLGSPGAERKPVLQLATDEGTILAYVKVGWNEQTNAMVDVEGATCELLARFAPTTFRVPSVLYSGNWQGRRFCIQSAPAGRVANAPRAFNREYLAVLKELSTIGPCRTALVKSRFWTDLRERIPSVRKQHHRDVLRQLACAIECSLGRRPVPFHFSHGDFTPWNARIVDKALLLIDWEQSCGEAPAGLDFFHFLIQTQRLLERRTPKQAWTALSQGMPRKCLTEYLAGLRVDQELGVPLCLIYLLQRLTILTSNYATDFDTIQYLTALANLGLPDGGLWR